MQDYGSLSYMQILLPLNIFSKVGLLGYTVDPFSVVLALYILTFIVFQTMLSPTVSVLTMLNVLKVMLIDFWMNFYSAVE